MKEDSTSIINTDVREEEQMRARMRLGKEVASVKGSLGHLTGTEAQQSNCS